MSKKVLAVAQAEGLGGAELALLRIAAHLPEHGFTVELTVPGEGPLAEAGRAAGLPVHRLPVGRLEQGGWPRAALSVPGAQRLAARLKPDVVWLNGTVAQRLTPGLWGRPLVPHLHDLLHERPRPWAWERFWRWAGPVMCDSQAVADRALELGAPAERLRVVWCPVEAVAPAPRPAWAGGGRVVGFAGRIEPRKGVLDLVEAVERLPDVRLVLVGDDDFGADPGYRERTLAAARALGDRAVVLGRVDDARTLMAWFDVLCLPSREEPFGTAAAEALAAGTPVVVTDSGGMPEYVESGHNGAVVAPASSAALAEAIESVLARSEELGRQGREDVSERFSTARVAGLAAAVLEEAIARCA